MPGKVIRAEWDSSSSLVKTYDETISQNNLHAKYTKFFLLQCHNLTRKEGEDYTTFASKVNKHCNDFRLAELNADNFKCLIFVQGLISTKDAEIRRGILNK